VAAVVVVEAVGVAAAVVVAEEVAVVAVAAADEERVAVAAMGSGGADRARAAGRRAPSSWCPALLGRWQVLRAPLPRRWRR
jgi:hypothetical protein